jgi:DNA polymerase-3 subunit epsilon
LLDSEILAEVYLELIGGRQPDFALASDGRSKSNNSSLEEWRPSARPQQLASKRTAEETAAHDAFVGKLGDDALWKKLS